MSLPSYLAKIQSSGVYRYVFDKSIVPSQTAGTLRLLIGYSEKGPFNTPVYIENKSDFINLFGNISKRLERKGVFFHRCALQALTSGPILALNIKPFEKQDSVNDSANESVNYLAFDPWDQDLYSKELEEISVVNVYNTDRFWKLDEDILPKKLNTEKYINIVATDSKDLSCTIFIRPTKPVEYEGITINDWYAHQTGEEMPAYLDEYVNRNLDEFFGEVYVFRGDFNSVLDKTTNQFANSLKNYLEYYEEDGMELIKLKDEYKNTFGEDIDPLEALANDTNSKFIAKYVGCMLPYFKDATGNYASLDILFNADHNTHKMLMKLDDEMIDDVLFSCFKSTEVDSYNTQSAKRAYYISGYEYNTITKTSTMDDIQKLILQDMVIGDKGIYTALTNRVDCEYHYIVDTFASSLNPTYKSALSSLAKAKDNAFAILNFPAMSLFVNDTKYINSATGKFDINEISKHGFTLPSEADGASYCAFYTNVVVSDGAVKNTIPSAALVSNLFMEKWNSRQPYYIVAGPNYGVIQTDGLVGPDYNFGRSDLDVLEPLGVNAIIYVPRKGTYINSNQTAKQKPVSALSKVHVRELVIYLQNEIESLLQNYQWELNTSTLRDTIKTKADTILERVAANGGVYDYLNVCDESNNTPEVIDNEMIILDTSIEPARGAGKMVQRLTIHKTGGISTLQ